MGWYSKPEVEAKAKDFLKDLAEKTGLEVADNGLHLSHPELGWVVDIDEMKTGDVWHRKGTGKLYINVGDYNNKKQFRERKDGSWSPEVIPYTKGYIQRTLSLRGAQQRARAAQDVAKAEITELDLPRFGPPVSFIAKSKFRNDQWVPQVEVKVTIDLNNLETLVGCLKGIGIDLS